MSITIQIEAGNTRTVVIERGSAPSVTLGQPGPSAYDVAVENGFIGTQAQWLASLQGPPGAAPSNFSGSFDLADGRTVTVINGVIMSIGQTAPNATAAPTITGSPTPGGTVTITEGTYYGAPAPILTGALYLGGVDVSAGMAGMDYTIPANTADGTDLTWTEEAANGIAPDATQSVTVTVSAAAVGDVFTLTVSGDSLTFSPATLTLSGDNLTLEAA